MGYAGPQRLRELLDAVLTVASGLELPVMLQHITELAASLVDARYAALGVLDESKTSLEQFITHGMSGDERGEIGELPKGHGILGVLIHDAVPLRLPDLREHEDSFGFPPNHPGMTSFLGVPIFVRGEAFGNLYLTEKTTGEVFTDVDEELVIGLAAAAGVAIENARLHSRVADLSVVEDRERIGRDLHDTIIQRLFATGMSLQGAAALVERDPSAASGRIQAAIDELDTTVKQIRTTIFALGPDRQSGSGLRGEILAVCEQASEPLGFRPEVYFDGPVDTTVPDDVATDLVATLRESLSNVARHASARAVQVWVETDGSQLTLRVVDDGVGMTTPPPSNGHGLPNMSERAARHGGGFEIAAGPPAGTTLVWRVPLRTSES